MINPYFNFILRLRNFPVILLLLVLFSGMSEATQFKFSGQYRSRGEYRNNRDFNAGALDALNFINQRTRLKAEAIIAEGITGVVHLQDSRLWGGEVPTTSGEALEGLASVATTGREKQTLDLLESYLEAQNIFDLPFTLKVGRQQLIYGEQRILGGFDWSNLATAFDAVKINYPAEQLEVDLFYSRLSEKSVTEGPVEAATGVRERADLLGVYSRIKNLLVGNLDLYALNLIDKASSAAGGMGFSASTFPVGNGNIQAYGLRVDGKKEAWDWKGEYVLETGKAWAYSLDANAYSATLGFTLPIFRQPRIGLEYNYASGTTAGEKARGERKTFYNFFPTNHLHYGYIDYFALKNVRELRVSLNQNLSPAVKYQLDWRKFNLATADDSWYHAGQGVMFSGPFTSDDAGSEIDLTLWYTYRKLAFQAGYSTFIPGNVLTAKGLSDPSSWIFVQLTTGF